MDGVSLSCVSCCEHNNRLHALFSGLFAAIKEKPKANQIAGVLIAMFGVYMLSGADSRADVLGITFDLLGAIAGGFYFAAARFAVDMEFGQYVFTIYASSAVVCLALCFTTDVELFTYPEKNLAVLLTVIPMLIGHTLLNYVVIPITASIIGEAVGAVILASIVLAQILSVETYPYVLIVFLELALPLPQLSMIKIS